MGSSLYSSSFPCGCGAGGGGGGGGTPGGLSGQVQFNSGGAFGGSNDFTYDGDRVVIKSLLITGTGFIEHISDLYIGDPLLTLNSGVSSPNTYDIGFIGDQGGGGTNNIGFIWDVDNTCPTYWKHELYIFYYPGNPGHHFFIFYKNTARQQMTKNAPISKPISLI